MTLILPLLPTKARPYAKAIVGLLGALASIAVMFYGDEPKVAAAVQVLTALGIYAQPNGSTGEEEFPEDGLPENDVVLG
ncbi:hypothetical protein [Streptomyces phage phiScoe15]|nr:hypothetical protein [Streptomyces phage phiScoe15]